MIHSTRSSLTNFPPASPSVIMRAQDASADPFKAVTETIGSGPFRFVRSKWNPGAKIVPDYVPRAEPAGCPHARCRAGDDGDLARKSHDNLSFCCRRRIVSQLLGSAQRSTGPSKDGTEDPVRDFNRAGRKF